MRNLFKFILIFCLQMVFLIEASAQSSKKFLYENCTVTEEMSEIPDDLYVEIYPIIITSINELESTYDYQFYLGYSYEIKDNLPYCFFESKDLPEGIFNPHFEFMNAIDIERSTPFGVEIEDDYVYVSAKYKGKIKGNFDFTLYPFDSQNLHLNISSTYSTDDFKIHLEEQTNSLLDKLEVQGWDKTAFKSELDIEKWDNDDEEYDLIRYSLILDRQVFPSLYDFFYHC